MILGLATRRRQLDLFGADGVGPAQIAPALRALGEALPEHVHLGTSSWSFPGWRGIVWDRSASRSVLAECGLAAYARHPVLRGVGIDRSYYDPLDAETYRAYADAVPEGFRFLVKAHRDLTTRRSDNPRYLDDAFARERVIPPWREGLGERAGPLVFQFPPQRASRADAPERFAADLHAFLERLPRGPLYAVEIRHGRWLTPRLANALADAGAVPCLTVHPSMPPLSEQAGVWGTGWPALVARWMLGGEQAYEDARSRYAPFDRLVDPDPATRRALAGLCRDAASRGAPCFVTVNNKAEGSAPLSVIELAREIGGAAPGG